MAAPLMKPQKAKDVIRKLDSFFGLGGRGENAHHDVFLQNLLHFFNPAHSPQISMNILKVEDPFSATT